MAENWRKENLELDLRLNGNYFVALLLRNKCASFYVAVYDIRGSYVTNAFSQLTAVKQCNTATAYNGAQKSERESIWGLTRWFT